MPAAGSVWPLLSGGRGSAPSNIHERVQDTNFDVRQLLNHISANNSIRVPKPVLECLQEVRDLTQDILRNPLGADWRKDIEDLARI